MATRLFGSQTSLREANRANLLASIHKFGAMTQVELAEVTGLSTATVSTLVHQLVDEDQLAMTGDVFIQPFNEALQRMLFPDAVAPIDVLVSSHPDDNCALGGALCAIEFSVRNDVSQ